MKTTNRRYRLFCSACAVACMLIGMVAHAQEKRFAYRPKDGDWVKDVEKMEYRSGADEYQVTKAGATYGVARANVTDLVVPKPSDFDKLANQLKAAADPGAMQAMEAIVSAYPFLVWDVEGLKVLVPIYRRKNEQDKVFKACNAIKSKAGKLPDVLLSAYWESLRETGKTGTLMQEIKDAVESGPRPMAAVAYVARGDILKKENKKQDALIEGYMRTVILFGDVKTIQPEALFKTWKTLKELNDGRAERFRRKLLDDYPDSDYSREL